MQSSLVQITLVHQYFQPQCGTVGSRNDLSCLLAHIHPPSCCWCFYTGNCAPKLLRSPLLQGDFCRIAVEQFLSGFQDGEEAVLMHKFGLTSGGKTASFQPLPPEDDQHVFFHPSSWLAGWHDTTGFGCCYRAGCNLCKGVRGKRFRSPWGNHTTCPMALAGHTSHWAAQKVGQASLIAGTPLPLLN